MTPVILGSFHVETDNPPDPVDSQKSESYIFNNIWPHSILTTYSQGHFCCCCSAAKLCLTLCNPMDCSTLGSPVLHYLLEFSEFSSNSCPLSRWCYLNISSSPASFSFWPQSFPISGAFPMSQVFASGGQSTGASASASVLPMNIEGWFPLGLIGLISMQSKRLSKVFSSITIRNHQFFSAQLSLWSNSHICSRLLEKS